MQKHPDSPCPALRVGIVGAGENTRAKHIPGLRALPGVEIAGVCNRRRASAERVAREWGIPRVYDDWHELVEAADTQAIVIGTWPCLHAPVTLAALAAGKHVLCEARMAMNAAEARAMRDAARAHPDRVAQVVPSPMGLGADRTVRRLISEGYTGEILAAEVRIANGAFVDPEAPLHWRQDASRSGLNVLALGIGYEALMRWIGEATAVAARGRINVRERRNAESGILERVRIPDHLDVIADMACGAQAHFQMSAVTGLLPAGDIALCGRDGTLVLRNDRLLGGRRGDAELRDIDIPERERGGWRVEEEFVNSIRGLEKVSRTTFDDGVRYMEFTEAVALSLAEGRTVRLPLPP